METKLLKYNIGVIFRKSNKYWKMDLVHSALSKYKNVNYQLYDVSDTNLQLPTDLDLIVLAPSESDKLADFIKTNQRLKWIHSMSSGVDKFLNIPELQENDQVILTNARGAYAVALAEFSIFSMLYYSFKIDEFLKGFKERKWVTPVNSLLNKKTLLIVGYGLNGVELAKKAKLGFDMKVIGIKRNPKVIEGKQYVDEVHSMDHLDQYLSEADYVVSILPFTAETVDIFNYEKFQKMQNSAVFINIGRGSSVAEEDLIRALKERIIYAASLDVFKQEPLPSNSPFYELDNVFLSNHKADFTDEYFKQGLDAFIKNLDSFLIDGSLKTIVDRKQGY